MRHSRLFAVGIATVALVAVSGWSGPSSAQTQATAAGSPHARPLGQQCIVMTDPFKGKLAGQDLPAGVIPVADADRSSILDSDMP